jgi:hypothetical protein
MEFELNGESYKASKLPARKQFHIARRLMPVIGQLVGAGKGGSEMETLANFCNGISSLSDEEADYVLFGLLASVQRKQPSGLGYAKIVAEQNVMFEDINNMKDMLFIAWQTARYNFSDFLAALPSALNVPALQANAQ